ncbi:hypothetical protein AB2L57_05680 [Microbacterium sp. HA-8]|uniref:hypothetical protein n=1 Tax=Microbacterium sp. HA-8 TaxID=3234200 RepID=UPI0038F74B73
MEHELIPSGEQPNDLAKLASEFLAMHDIEVARREGRDIDVITARMFASLLQPSPDSALARFANTGEGTNASLRAEYLPIYHQPGAPEEVTEAIDWLGAHLVTADNARPTPVKRPPGSPKLRNILWQTDITVDEALLSVSVRADTPVEAVETLGERLGPLMTQDPVPWRLFLALPDVDAASDHLVEAFEASYRGAFESEKQLLDAFTDAPQIRDVLDGLRDRFVGGYWVEFDEAGLLEELREHKDVIFHEGRFHVFDQ